ncbi:Structural maintenance of chromosomes protein 1 [Coemansia sp. RSA 990]|nr:Structural maintenance of chromosomes protein 1 [Coemansia sp. RSA 1086]KAJ1748048.1 Structural maintenance of chromosomes protein 1 [Coemansia sp. RSA 1821]KAJ1870475.1 Structural maintenance of chromosomes protein 1 [Coemansia sp. RSA 990]
MGRLVQLELENFKSYRGQQVIGPFSSFTAVVGPNGAGKSNLMDAISFVLGVRSGHLRSSHLKDLVYRGRAVDSNKDDAIDEAGDQRARRAWVRAIYEDDEGSTIIFQRSISAAGDSEYRINNRAVSLQAYNQTLEAQNILVKAKNFLVFQGDVEAVAAQSPKDLTQLIEQISGSAELQSEYNKLEKLQEAAAERSTFAYNKKRAVAAEVQSISEQKKELDLYESKHRLRTKLNVQHMLFKLFVAESRIDAIKQDIDALHGGSIAQASEQRTQLDASLQSQKKMQAKAYKAVNRQERQIKLVEQKIETQQPILAGLGEKMAHTERRLKQIDENVANAQVDTNRQREVVTALEDEHARVKESAARFDSELQGTQAQRSSAPSEAAMREFSRLSEQLRSACVEDMHTRDVQDRQIQLLTEQSRRMANKADGLQSQLEGLSASERVCLQQQQAAEAEVKSIEQEMQQARRESEAAKSAHERLLQMEVEQNEKLEDVLKNLSQARAEQRESAREAKLKDMVSALQRVFTGVHGRLVDLCQPTQHKYDIGVATVLGRHMDAIVVDQQATAIECISYIKEQRAGQATFLPLDTLQPQSISDGLRHVHRGARLATDVLQYDSSIEAAVMHACGNALICDTLQVARYVCYERKLDAKAVTLDGTVIHRSGLITGGIGSHKQRSKAQAWEAAAVDNLRKARDRLTEELQEIARERRKLAKDEATTERLAGLQTRHRISREDLDSLSRKLQGLATERRHIETKLEECRPIAEQTATELEAAKEARNQANTRIYAAAEPIFVEFCRQAGVSNLQEFEQQLLPATEAADERRLQFKTQMSRLESQLVFEQQQLEEATAKLDKLLQAQQSTRETLDGLGSELTSKQAEMDGLVAQIEVLRRELAALNTKYSDATEDVHMARHTLDQGQKELDSMNKELRARATEMERALAEKAAVLRKCKIEDIPLPLVRGSLQALPLDVGIGSSSESQLAESYMSQLSIGDTQSSAMSIDGAEDIVPDYSTLPQADRTDAPVSVDQKYVEEIARLGVEIDSLNPNPHARERLESARARLHEIEVEHNAARQEARDTKASFQAVRKRRHDIFMRCYNHLATAIDHAYKALTQSPLFPLGGTAYLALEDPESPYLAGVKYHAMPPLKRFRDMDQLSGGEKTVAALALLFSLQTFRPAPFFVLDEVDAALDLANVSKLANFLRQNARSSATDAANEQESGDDGDNDDAANASHYSLRRSTLTKRAAPEEPARDSTSQFIVISLKQTLFERAHSLVGIYRDQAQNSSQVLTLDLEQFA